MKNGIVTALLWSISLLAAPSIAQDNDSVGPRSQMQEDEKGSTKQAIEYKIAGLRPGKDTIDKAYDRFHKDRVFKELSPPSSAVWLDSCNRQMLTVVFEGTGIIREVRIEHKPSGEVICTPRSYSRSTRARIGGTGRGLALGDSCNRIPQLYGAPQSQRRSIHGDKEFVYYFDPAVKGNSLTFELRCHAADNEVETIKLALSSPTKP